MDCSGNNTTQAASLSITTALVTLQVLGLALYQAGALHLKSINNILLQALINIALGSLLWYSVGYSLVFGSSQEGFIGNPDKAFFIDVSPFNCSTHAQNVPSILFAVFEMTIAVCAPFIVIAPWTEHISIIGSMTLFILWPITVYYPISHWIRGAGWLTRLHVLDYAGSLTVHTSAGTAGVVFTRMLKPHIPSRDADSKTSHHHGEAHHHVMFLVGALVIIIGWSLFNVCTVQMVQNASVGLAVVNTQLSSCASCLCWVLVFTIGSSQCLYSDMLTGIIAGIIGVSAAPASVHPWASILTGILTGVTSALVLTCARQYFPSWTNGSQVDIIYSHGIPGCLGALAAGLFANPILDAHHHRGAFYSNGKQLGVQLLAVVVVVLWTAVCTYLITWFIHLTVGFNIITHSAAVDVALPGHTSSSKLHSQFLQREKLFSAAITGQIRDLEDLAAKQVNFGIKDFDKRTALLLASSHGHIQCVKLILRQPGVDIHAKDRWGATAVTEAIKYGHDRVVQCLIRHGASWAEDGAGGLLCTAVVKNDIEEISRLVALGVDVNASNSDGNCAIHVASKLGSRAVVQYLIDQRAEINTIDSSGNAPLNYADMHEHRAVSQLLESLGARRVSRHYSIQEICEVASTGNLQMLRHMVHNGASICYRDVNHRTPLHVSSAEGHLDVVKFLVLQPGIDINARDRNQFTPLLEAIVNKHHEVVEFLKSHGAAVNECKLASLVTEKAREGDTKCLKRMLRWSGHVNICDFDGQTALHMAAVNGRTEVVSMLLREGADPTLVNRFNKTPLELASSFHHTSVEKELRKHLKLSTVSEDKNQTDDNTTSCYHRKSKTRRRKYKTEPSTYHYSPRDSWSSTDVSAEARKHLESSASTDNTSQQILSMRDVQNHQDNNVLRPSFLRVMPVSQLSPQTRELTGGQPDYV